MGCRIVEVSKSARKRLMEYLFSLENEKPREEVLLGKGFSLEDNRKENFIDIILKDSNRKGHIIGFGTTGAGKSRLAESLVEQDIYNGRSIVIIDPKLDNGLLSRTYQACLKTQCENDFMLLSSVFPELSVKINPLSSYYIVDEIINHTMASVPAKDEFFYNIAMEIVTCIVHSLLIIKKEQRDNTPINAGAIYEYVSYSKLTTLKDSLSRVQSDNDETKAIVSLIDTVLASPTDYFSKVTSTLRTTLTQMTIGSIGKIIGNAKTNKFIEKLENNERVILYVQTPSMLSKTTSDITAKIVLSMIQSCVGRVALKDEVFKNGLSIYIDEASNCFYRGVENLFNKSRSTNTMITALTQNYADFIDAVGQDKARMILGNANGKLFMRLVDPDTAENASKYSGEMVKWDSMISTNGIMTRESKVPRLTADDLLSLHPREFYYFGMEGKFQGKTANVGNGEIKILMPKNNNQRRY
jgi:conjugal transfer pilus assembly protein TraD